MGGLLDFLSTPAGQGLLGAAFSGMAGARRGAPVNTLGAAGVGGLLAYNQAQEGQIKQQLQKAQLDDLANQAQLRGAQLDQMKRRNQMIDSLLNPGAAAAPVALAQGAQIGDQPGGFDGNGAYTPPVKNVGPTVTNLPRLQQVQSGPVSGGGTYGIPRDAIAMDLALNDGKSVGDWMFKRGTPDMQVSNGYAYDKNNLNPGFIPQMNVSQDGKATVTTIGQNGMPVVSAPNGAQDVYAGYRNIDESAKAAYDLQKVWDPARQQYVFVPRSQVVQSSNPSPTGTPPNIPNSAPAPLRNNNPGAMMPRGKLASYPTPEAGLAALDQNLQAYGKQGVNTLGAVVSKWAPPGENNTDAYIADVSKRIGLDPNAKINLADPVQRHLISAGIIAHENGTKAVWGSNRPSPMAAEPSIPEQSSAKGNEKYTVDVAGDTAAQRKSIMEAGMSAPDRIAKIQQIGTLLSNVDGGSLTPQGTQLASAANSWGLKIDKNLPNKEAASALGNELALSLRSTAGGGGMPGSLSDSDRQFLVSMTPNMSQSKQGRDMLIQSMTAVEQRKSDVADMARRYEQKYGVLDNNFFRQLQQWSNTHPLFKK